MKSVKITNVGDRVYVLGGLDKNHGIQYVLGFGKHLGLIGFDDNYGVVGRKFAVAVLFDGDPIPRPVTHYHMVSADDRHHLLDSLRAAGHEIREVSYDVAEAIRLRSEQLVSVGQS